jgi:1,4-alpha-glucan branching enzyme
VLLAVARQYIKVNALTIGTPARKWTICADSEILDQIATDIRLNSLVGNKEDGKLILEAESIDDSDEDLSLTLIGENESGPLKIAWMASIFAFFAFPLALWPIKKIGKSIRKISNIIRSIISKGAER